MLQDPAFVRKVKERIGYFKSNLAVILAQVDGEAAYAEASVVEDNRLWHNLKPEGAADSEVKTAFRQEVRAMKEWLTARLDRASFQD